MTSTTGNLNGKELFSLLPEFCCAVVMMSSCGIEGNGATQRDAQRLAGVGLRHSVISVRPRVGALGRSRLNSSAANRSTALNLQQKNEANRCLHTRLARNNLIYSSGYFSFAI